MPELSSELRRLASEYVAANEKDYSRETYAHIRIAYSYHEYAISCYEACVDAASRHLLENFSERVPYETFAAWENSCLSMALAFYFYGRVVFDSLRSVTDFVQKNSQDASLKSDLLAIRERYRADIRRFADVRNHTVAHPFETSGRYHQPGSALSTFVEGGAPSFVLHAFRIDESGFAPVQKTDLHLCRDRRLLEDFIKALLPLYRRFLVR